MQKAKRKKSESMYYLFIFWDGQVCNGCHKKTNEPNNMDTSLCMHLFLCER